jgi:hypothetical protein
MNLVNVSTYGVQVASDQQVPYTNGVYGVWARSDAFGSLNVGGLTVNGSAIMSQPASGSAMRNQSGGSPLPQFAFNFIPAPVLTPTVAGNIFQCSWPATYLGWTLQTRTNTSGAGASSDWIDVSGSTATNQFSMNLDNNSGSVLFRLINL